MATAAALTGGTGDVNPQLLSVTVVQAAVDQTTTVEIPLPIPRFTATSSTAIVMEIFRVDYHLRDGWPPSLPPFAVISASLNTRGSDTSVGGTDTFSSMGWGTSGVLSEAQIWVPMQITDVLHDGAGHGFLVATDAIFFTVRSQEGADDTGRANEITFKVLYRYKRVSLAEYIGIVQSQQ